MNKVLIIIFAIFFLILFPLGEFLRIDLPNNIAVTGTDAGVIILILFCICKAAYDRLRIEDSGQAGMTKKWNVLKPLAIFLTVCLISLLYNLPHLKQNEFLVAFLYLLRFTCYASFYFIVTSLPQAVKKTLSSFMIASGFFLLVIGYVQYFFYPSLRNLYYLGWDEHLYRMFGSFFDPNFFGAFLVLYFLFVLNQVIPCRAVTNVPKRFAKQLRHPVFLILVLLGTLIAIVLTYSRSAYLMLVVGLVTFFLFKKPSKKIILYSLIFISVSFISFFSLTKYSEGTNLFRINSTKARITTSQNALIIFEKNPLLGVGFNAYRYAQERYGFTKQNDTIADHGAAGADNSFLFVLATTGIIGFLAYANLWGKIFVLNKKRALVISSMTALFFDAFFINSLFYPFIVVWMWVIIGIESKSI